MHLVSKIDIQNSLLAVGFVFVILLGFVVQHFFWKNKIMSILSAHRNIGIMFPGYSSLKSCAEVVTLCLGIMFLCLSALRISTGEQKMSFSQEGRNVLFILDVSRSMLATDISSANPSFSRLDFAKLKIRSIIEALGPERVGLILFADKPFLQCPFTRDFKIFLSFLDSLDQGVVSKESGTDLNSALELAHKSLSKSNSSSKVVILITDGEDFSKEKQNPYKKMQNDNVSIFALGVGSEAGAPIPIFDNLNRIVGHEKNDKNEFVLTKLDAKNLNNLTSEIGGEFCRAAFGESDVLKAKTMVEKKERQSFDDRVFTIKNETYHYFAFLSFIFFVVGQIIRVFV